MPSSASVVNLLQLSSSNSSSSSSSSLSRSNTTTNVTVLASRRPVLELKQWRKRAGGGGSLLPTPEEEAHVAAVDKMEGEAEALQMRRRVSEQQRTLRTPIFLSINEGLHPASPEEVQAAAMLRGEELAEMKYQSSRSPPPPALEAVQRLHGMPHPAEAAITFPHGRSDSVVNDVRVGGSSRTVHHPRRARGNWPEQTDLRIKRPHLREADDPSGIPRQSFIAIEQREARPASTAGSRRATSGSLTASPSSTRRALASLRHGQRVGRCAAGLDQLVADVGRGGGEAYVE